MDLRVTKNWFKGQPKSNFREYLERFKGKSPTFLEIGCWEGVATRWMLKNFTDAQVHVIDTFEGGSEHQADDRYELEELYDRFSHNTQGFQDRLVVHQGLSQEILRGLPLESFDFVYVDGSHYLSDVAEDLFLAFRLLSVGGILIADDYTWHGYSNVWRNPMMAIDFFKITFAERIRPLEFNKQAIFEKIKS